MIRFTLTRQKAGLTEMRIDTEESKEDKDEAAEGSPKQDMAGMTPQSNATASSGIATPLSNLDHLEGDTNHMLNAASDEYISKFKLICEQMEKQFFSKDYNGQYIFGDKPSVFDFALYHDLMTAMLLPNIGKSNELFSEDNRFRLYKVKNLNKWYYTMSRVKVNRRLATEFIASLKGKK